MDLEVLQYLMTSVEQYVCQHLTSLGHNELITTKVPLVQNHVSIDSQACARWQTSTDIICAEAFWAY